MFKQSKIVYLNLNLIIILGQIQMVPANISQRQQAVSIFIQINNI